jgi:(1->4)-alpha-D-glucan 1-alpha-D-glucosylmutase
MRNWEDGRIKMFVIWRALNFRRDNLDLFLQGDYIPLEVTGSKASNVIAFARRLENRWAIVAVPRLCSQLTRARKPPLGPEVWRDTTITPPTSSFFEWRDIFTGAARRTLSLAELFSDLPFSLLQARRGVRT